MSTKLLRTSTLPFFVAGFFNAFVDLGHKIVIQNALFKSYDGAELILRTTLIQAMVLLPFVLVMTPAGFFADKYPKHIVMRIAAFAAIPITLLITLCYYQGWFDAAFLLTFLLALQSAIYSPAKYGYVKELVGATRLAKANSVLQASTIAAILLGSLCYTLLFEHWVVPGTMDTGIILQQIRWAGWGLVVMSFVEFMLTMRLPRRGDNDTRMRFRVKHYVSAGYLRAHLRDAWRLKAVRQSIVGLALFWGVNQVLLSAFGAWYKECTGNENTAVINGILAASAIGIALGSVYAARMSRNFIETGLIPLGAAGLTLCLIGFPFFRAPWVLGALFAVLGFCGGMLLVPLNALIQFHTRSNTAGHIIAANNFIQTIAMLLLLVATMVVSSLGITMDTWFRMLAVLALIATIWALCIMPQSLIRMVIRALLATRYQLKVQGLDNVPAEGGVLFLGNHVSWLDWAFLQMACPRPIRFVMYRPYYEKWYLRWLLNRLQVIPISSNGAAEALTIVKESLAKGEAVALFPEGHISRNGALGMFRAGFEKAAAGTGAAIVPFYLQGLWGSFYSFAAGKYRRNTRQGKLARSITVAFGTPLDCYTSAQEVKTAVQELSISAWQTGVSSMRPIGELWLTSAQQVGTAPAVFGHDGVHWSGYRSMAAVFSLAHQFDRHIGDRQRVGVLLPPSAAGAFTCMALLLRGHTIVPLNYSASTETMVAAIGKANLDMVVTSTAFLQKLSLRGVATELLQAQCKMLLLEDLRQEMTPLSQAWQLAQALLLPNILLRIVKARKVQMDDTAAILFSSGSEGTPKGVELSHANLVGNIAQVASLLNPHHEDIMLSALPIFHAFGLTVTTLLPMVAAIPMVMQPDPTDAKAVGRLCAEHRVTLLCATGTFLRMYSSSRHVHPLQFSSLRLVVAGAEKLRSDVREAFRSRFGLDIHEGYGCTETTPVASVNVPDILLDDFRSVQVGHKPGTVGQALPGSRFRIVDPETSQPLPVGMNGLVLIGGTQIMKGYWQDEARTAAAMVEIDGVRWYRSGDKGHLDEDGFLTIVDRYSRFAKLGGEMVGLAMVEEKLQSLLPIGSGILVVAIPDAAKGEVLVALYNANENAEDLSARVRAAGWPPLWIPSRYLQLEQLPLLGSGKVDYSLARQLAAA